VELLGKKAEEGDNAEFTGIQNSPAKGENLVVGFHEGGLMKKREKREVKKKRSKTSIRKLARDRARREEDRRGGFLANVCEKRNRGRKEGRPSH